MERDFILNTIIRDTTSKLNALEARNDAEREFLAWFSEADERLTDDVIITVMKSQSKSIKNAIMDKRPIRMFGFGNFEIKHHDQIIFDLMLEEAEDKGYKTLREIKSPTIMKGLKAEVNRKRKPLLQEAYHFKRKVMPFGNPAVLRFDFLNVKPKDK